MPLFLDIHRDVGPVTPEDIAKAHEADVAVQTEYGVAYHQYWYNPESNSIFCLAEGPDKETCARVHREAHGLVADDIIEVQPELVQAFMGPLAANRGGHAVTSAGTVDPGSRVLLLTEIDNFADAASSGDDVALDLLATHDRIVRAELSKFGGREVRHTGEGILACFATASSALRFASEVQQKCASECQPANGFTPRLRIGMVVGEPVERHSELFGISVTKVRRICQAAEPCEVLVSGGVCELAGGKGFHFDARGNIELKGFSDPVSVFRLNDGDPKPMVAAPPQVAVSAEPSRVGAVINELKRRRVLTVAVAYAGVFYALLQVAQLTFDPLHLPSWTYTLLLVLGIMAFPIVMVLTWFFDITPHGVKRT